MLLPFAGEKARTYRVRIDAILANHELVVPDLARDVLAREMQRIEQGFERADVSPRREFRQALGYATKLRGWVQKPPAREASITICANKLLTVLRSEHVARILCISLAVRQRRIALWPFLQQIERDPLNPRTLDRLIEVLGDNSGPTAPPGSSTRRATFLVRACCLVWKRAAMTEHYSWNEARNGGELTGPLPKFVRAVLSESRQTMSDRMLKQCLIEQRKLWKEADQRRSASTTS